MIISMYSREKFPLNLRTEFELVAWPYNQDYKHLFIKQMQDLTVFRYEDNEFDEGGRNIGYPINIGPIDNSEFTAYYNWVAVSNDRLKVIPWPADRPEGADLLAKLDNNSVTKDRMAWFFWNAPVIVKNWNSLTIQRQILEDQLYEFCDKKGCYNYSQQKFKVVDTRQGS